MTIPKPDIDDLQLAWKRLLRDREARTFVADPHFARWVSDDLTEWLASIAERLEAGVSPHASRVCLAPKSGNTVRRGTVLHVEDELVYYYLVSQLFPQIRATLGPLQGGPDMSHLLGESDTAVNWVRSGANVWGDWRRMSLQRLECADWVLFTDMAACYDNIDLATLSSDLRSLCGNDPHIQALMDCLNRWSDPRGRGIPQGYSASHVLAKVYLYSLDSHLSHSGYTHIRYVDDLRIFCQQRNEARSALLDLTHFLSKRGLQIQGAKTHVLRAEDARQKIDGVAPIIEDLQSRVREEIEEAIEVEGPYATEHELLEALEDSENPPTEILVRAFQEHIDGRAFDKTLFHYLLTRLGKAGSRIAVEYCLECIKERPEETEAILRYLNDVGVEDADAKSLGQYFHSAECLYMYQKYLFMRWCVKVSECRLEFVTIARSWAFDSGLPDWLRAWSIALLGLSGERYDLERLEMQYDEEVSDLLRAECVFANRKQEVARRNAFFSKVGNDSEMVRRAVTTAKQST